MSYFQSIFLGVLQGLTEFLPISSSAHLAIAPWAFHFPDPGLAFDVALHLGTLLAIVSYFWRDWLDLLQGSTRAILQQKRSGEMRLENRQSLKLFLYLALATIPGAVAGFLLDDLAETRLRHPLLIAADMAVLGVLLFLADRKGDPGKGLDRVTFKEALLIGAFQALALFPGVSRSGVTITTALFLGFSRVSAARFSFLLATPITLGAVVFKVGDMLKQGVGGPEITGIFVSAVAGFASIKYLLKYVQSRDYRVFSYYRFLFAALVFLKYFDVL